MPSSSSLLAFLLVVATAPLGAQTTPDLAPYLIADRAAEVALARTAAPPSVSDAAAVLVLTPHGYVEAAPGSNGFKCLVLRSFAAPLNDSGFWNPRVRSPLCYNPPAAQTILPQDLKRAEWVIQGLSLSEIGARTERAYASHELSMPAMGAMSYMLSPKQYLQDANPTSWMPHLMVYFEKSTPAAAWGAGDGAGPVIDGSGGDPHSPVLTYFIPVRRWSDGTSALGEGAHH